MSKKQRIWNNQDVDYISSSLTNTEIGISLLNYGSTSDTMECCESIFESAEFSLTIGILENGSDDNIKKTLQEEVETVADKGGEFVTSVYGSELSVNLYEYTDDTEVQYNILLVDSEKNLGFCLGNNLLVELFFELSIKFSLILNNDVILQDNVLSRLKSTCEQSDVVAVSPLIKEPSGDLWYAGGDQWSWGYSYKADLERDGFGYVDELSRSAPYETGLYSGACVLFPTNQYIEHGGMFEPFFISIDEPEFSHRIRSNGHKIMVDPRTTVVHSIHSTLGGPTSEVQQYFYLRNMLYYSKQVNTAATHPVFVTGILSYFLTASLLSTMDTRELLQNRSKAVLDFCTNKLGPGHLYERLNAWPPSHAAWDRDRPCVREHSQSAIEER